MLRSGQRALPVDISGACCDWGLGLGTAWVCCCLRPLHPAPSSCKRDPACLPPAPLPALQERVRKDISEWLRYLRNSIGFDGWRFDYVKVNEVKAAATCLSCMSAGLPCVPARVLLGLPYNRKCFTFTCCRRCCVLTCTAGV